ncbi:BA75_02193T0 [Komagataella pastoris]|uniref:Restriction of telomere capping protein 4 n=1 Tax=Komagataella pastoris TaxID=4922 RepID=A0A1B2JBU3_PICPA|nr:BA75_02193T0 [Komagataella pastoris]
MDQFGRPVYSRLWNRRKSANSVAGKKTSKVAKPYIRQVTASKPPHVTANSTLADPDPSSDEEVVEDRLLSNLDSSNKKYTNLELSSKSPKKELNMYQGIEKSGEPVVKSHDEPAQIVLQLLNDKGCYTANKKAQTKESVMQKYSSKKFFPIIVSYEALRDAIEPHLAIVPAILNGSKPSYFYSLAYEVSKSSKNRVLTKNVLENTDMTKFEVGYLGKKRAGIISDFIRSKYQTILSELGKSNPVIQFWSVDMFVTCALTPEVISRYIKDEMRLSDLSDAYDLMEWTSDYGKYIMDTEPVGHAAWDENTNWTASSNTMDLSPGNSPSDPESETDSLLETGTATSLLTT